ncbi:MAG: hypothetical protein HRT89_09215 [Lentisphaeria bacterium]|nr:hypothetical protein [Lentisphaeria bacterium]NQZ68238.1 hypothetical protein [Lentisphaeria bacterium]
MKYAHSMTCITPLVGTGLAGYARENTSHGIYDDLYLQALLLDDEKGGILILISADLAGFEKEFADRLRRWISKKKPELSMASIIFSATHTHCGPATIRLIDSVGKMNPDYMSFLEKRIKETITKILSSELKKGVLFAGIGRCTLGMNRRFIVRDKDGQISDVLMSPNPNGSVDHSLPVLQVKGKDEEIIVLNYACHPTTRGGYNISGDYPAAAARVIRASSYKTRHAMFLQGAAADIRVPCMTEDGKSFRVGDSNDVLEYGNIIAKSVETTLKNKMKKITASFASSRSSFVLPYSDQKPTGIDTASDDYHKTVSYRAHNERHGMEMEVTAWQISKDCVVLAMSGEICHVSGKLAKKMSGTRFPFFIAYANGLPGYIPTDKILEEGGYEADQSMIPFGHPFLLKSGIDDMLELNIRKALDLLK